MSSPITRVIKDAKEYAARFGFSFSKEALAILRDVEELASSLDTYVYIETYMAVMLKRIREVRAAIARHGADPDVAAALFDDYVRKMHRGGTSYDADSDSFSSPYKGNRSATRAALIDLAINLAHRDSSKITPMIWFEAALIKHEDVFPMIGHADLSDSRLHTPFTTLAHITGHYDANLFIKLSDLRNDLGLPVPETSYEHPSETAPPSIRSALQAFFVDHPQYERNCFLVMPFSESRLHKEVTNALRAAMKRYGFNLVRADDHVYSEDLLTNIQAYIYGCRFGVAVFDRILTNDFNPNVSLEVGYLMGLRKPVCLLKERTLPRLPSDLVGRLYVEFDAQDASRSIPVTLNRWLAARGLIRNGRTSA